MIIDVREATLSSVCSSYLRDAGHNRTRRKKILQRSTKVAERRNEVY